MNDNNYTQFTSPQELKNQVTIYLKDPVNYNQQVYGPINQWDVSQIEDMSNLFDLVDDVEKNLNEEDFSNWKVGQVTNMKSMFDGCLNFKGNGLKTWDVSKVQNMSYMFWGCTNLDSNLSDWNVGQVTNMNNMFYECESFRGSAIDEIEGLFGLENWDVGNVIDMSGMFNNCLIFNSDLSNWNVGAVTDMNRMFYSCEKFQGTGLENWNVGIVTNMEAMFEKCLVLIGDLSNWDVSKVTTMNNMFYQCENFNNNLSSWDIAKVTGIQYDIQYMFYYCLSFRGLGLENWNISGATNILFDHCIDYTLVNADAIEWLKDSGITNQSLIELRPSNTVLATGNNENGQLGLGDTDDRSTFTQVLNMPTVNNVPIVSVSTGENHTVALDCQGIIYAVGKNDKGQLGLGNTTDIKSFTKVDLGYGFMVKQIACGKNFTMIVNTENKVYATGNNKNGQLGLDNTEKSTSFIPVTIKDENGNVVNNIIDVACGTDFTIILSEDGNIYSTGANDTGQLGLGNITDKSEFTEVPFSGNVKKIACGGKHSMIIDKNSILYGTGIADEGQLGLNYTTSENTFTQVEVKQNNNPIKIKDVACGNNHTILLNYSNEMFSSGRNNKGQLGQTKLNNLFMQIPFFTQSLGSVPMKKITCGLNHTGTIQNLPFRNNCYGFGQNDLGQLGLENKNNKSVPTEVPNINNVYSIYSNCTAQSTFIVQFISEFLTPIPPNVKPCYNKNTKIKCLIDNTIQSVPIQNLTTETRVLTQNGPKLVTKLTHHVQKNNKKDPNRMFRYKNLLLSGRHRTIVDFKPDKKLNPRTYSCGYSVPCSGDLRFTEVVSDSDFDLYNFTLENTDINHRDIIEIEGVLVETTSEWYLKNK